MKTYEVYLDKSGMSGKLFDYNFIGEPVSGDVIVEGKTEFTIIRREWRNGKLVLIVTDVPTHGVIKA